MSKLPPAEPAQDEPSYRFEVRDGIRRVTCTIANETIDEVSGLASPVSTALRRRAFDRMRTFIHEAAVRKLAQLPLGPAGGASGSIILVAHDLRGLPRDARLSIRGPAVRDHAAGPVASMADGKPAVFAAAA